MFSEVETVSRRPFQEPCATHLKSHDSFPLNAISKCSCFMEEMVSINDGKIVRSWLVEVKNYKNTALGHVKNVDPYLLKTELN